MKSTLYSFLLISLTVGSDIVYAVYFIIIRLRELNFFGAKEFFYMIFDFKNGCKNEFNDKNEKSCSWSRKFSKKIRMAWSRI